MTSSPPSTGGFTALVSPPADHAGPKRWYLVRRSELAVADDESLPVTGPGAPAPAAPGVVVEEPAVFVGLDGDTACWAVGVPADAGAPEGLHWQPLMSLGLTWPTGPWLIAGRAVQLVEWLRTSAYCGRCGTATDTIGGERTRRCPACGLDAYPRLAPAVIVLIRRGDTALLAAGRGFRGGMYSALAGFVEPGEDLEDTVRREVMEEVGVTLGSISYVGSQPWPFPHSLMLGFEAEWASGEPTPDGVEILDAGWYEVDDLPNIPPPVSIARTLIDRWVTSVWDRG